MTEVPSNPRRRWFQFSLATIFVVVTVPAVWLGWELHHVRERDRLLRSPVFLRLFEYRPKPAAAAAAATSVRSQLIIAKTIRNETRPKVAAGPPPSNTIPYLWRLAGDKPVENMDIFLPDDQYTSRDARRIQSLFPECAVTVVPAEPQ
jgi:hypothetical protein